MRGAVVRFGPAGWTYKDWGGVVYPRHPPRRFDPLEYLSRYFDTLEINNTFYRPATEKVARQWAERVSGNPRFRFTAKLLRRFTHERALAWTRDEVAEARRGLDALHRAGRLGAVLVQFPWSFRRTDENREWLRDLLSAFDGLPRAVEVRHDSWDVPDLYEGLEARGVGFVNIDQPAFKHSLRPSAVATAQIAYVRVHGRNYHDWFRKAAGRDQRYDYLYTAEELRPWAERVKALASEPGTKELYVVTNNHFRGKAPANALMLQAMVEGHAVKAPPELCEAYPEALAGLAWPDLPPPSAEASAPA